MLRNELNPDHHYVAFLLEGTECNRDAIGARIEVVVAGDAAPRVKTLRAGEGFLSQSSKWIHFGLGKESEVRSLEIRWPSGRTQTLERVTPDRVLKIEEPS